VVIVDSDLCSGLEDSEVVVVDSVVEVLAAVAAALVDLEAEAVAAAEQVEVGKRYY
jgi:hypothetical protein